MKVKDICLSITDGSHNPPKGIDRSGFLMLSSKNIFDDQITLDDPRYLSEEAFVTEDRRTNIKPGDVLLTIVGTVGRSAVVFEGMPKFALQRSVAVLHPNNDICHSRYLMYALQGKRSFIESHAKGVAQKGIYLRDVSDIDLPMPDKIKQLEIINTLDIVGSIIKSRNQELKELDNLIKARFVEMFGNGHDGKCDTRSIGDICKFQQGTQVPVEQQEEEQLEGYQRFLRIIDYTQAPQPPRYVNVAGRVIDEFSVVVVRYGATAGFVGRGYSGILANNLFEVIPDESVLSKDFLYMALKHGTFERDIHEKAFGAAMPALSFSMMKDISIVTPSIEDQVTFGDFVKQVDKSKAVVQKALVEAQVLFDSLMQEYFG